MWLCKSSILGERDQIYAEIPKMSLRRVHKGSQMASRWDEDSLFSYCGPAVGVPCHRLQKLPHPKLLHLSKEAFHLLYRKACCTLQIVRIDSEETCFHL